MFYLDIFKALVYTAVFSLLATPLDFKLALAIGAIDVPKDARRMHTRPIPRIGGISVFTSFVIFSLIFCRDIAPDLICLLSGAIFVVVLGIADDALGLSAKVKLTVQVLSAVFTVSGMFFYYDMGIFLATFGVLWLLTLTNAHNFIDGLDGLCTGISISEAIGLSVLFFTRGEISLGYTAMILAGACVGFFPYNEKNAKIFIGDTGATFLGFTLGALSFRFLLSSRSISALISMCLIFSIPLCDLAFAVTRRIYHKKSVFCSDRSHIHHILADSTLGHRKASLFLRYISLLSSVTGVLFALFFHR